MHFRGIPEMPLVVPTPLVAMPAEEVDRLVGKDVLDMADLVAQPQ